MPLMVKYQYYSPYKETIFKSIEAKETMTSPNDFNEKKKAQAITLLDSDFKVCYSIAIKAGAELSGEENKRVPCICCGLNFLNVPKPTLENKQFCRVNAPLRKIDTWP